MPKVIQIVEDDVKVLITDIKDGFEKLLTEIRGIGGSHVPTVNKLAEPLTAKLEALHQSTATAEAQAPSAAAPTPEPEVPAPAPEPQTPEPASAPQAEPVPAS